MPKERYLPSRGIRLSKTVSSALLTKACAQLGKNTHSNTRHRVGTGNIKTVEGASDAINSKGGKNVKTDTPKKKEEKNNTRIPGCVSQIAPLLRERKREKKIPPLFLQNASTLAVRSSKTTVAMALRREALQTEQRQKTITPKQAAQLSYRP